MPLFSPASNPSSPFASVRGDHAGLRVPDLASALAWYGERLDFRLMGRMEGGDITWAFLAPADDEGFQIELVAGPGAVDRPPYDDLQGSLGLHGWAHVCLRVDSVDDALAELRGRDVHVVAGPMDVAGLERRIAFFADPWGNLFELTQAVPAS